MNVVKKRLLNLFSAIFSVKDSGLAQSLRANQEAKAAIKRQSEKKKGGGAGFTPEDEDDYQKSQNPSLDALWENVREQLTDMVKLERMRPDLTNPRDTSCRLRFSETCAIYDKEKQGHITLKQLEQAFVHARISPTLTSE